jgi:nitrile hydratase
MSDQESDQGHHHPRPLSAAALRAKAIESLLVEKGLLASDAIDRVVEIYEKEVGPLNGAKVVARAWCDPGYKRRLLNDGAGAIAELGFGGFGGEHLVVVENTPKVHNVVCCTLCSCYPWAVMGFPPTWYKSLAYRLRIVREPRAVLQEFGLELPESVEIRVWDSSAEIRYMVLPERPAATADVSEAELSSLVTRDSLIGVAKIEGSSVMRTSRTP